MTTATTATDNGGTQDRPAETAGNVPGARHLGLFDVWGLVRRRKGLIAFGLGLGLALACLYYFQATPIYESEVQILVMQKDPNLPTQGMDRGYDAQRPSMYEDLLSTHVQLLRSPRVVKQAIKKHKLESLPTIVEQVKQEKDPVEYIIEELQVSKGGEGRAKDAHVLRATFRGPSAKDCAVILSAVVESYQDFLGATFQDTSQEAMELISRAKTELGEELQEKETAYQEFREQSPLLWKGEESSNVHQERLAEIERSLSQVRVYRTEAKARLDVLEEAFSSGDVASYNDLDRLALLSNKEVERLSLLLAVTGGDARSEVFMAAQPARDEKAHTEYQRLLSLYLEEKTLLEDFGPDHPRVQTVREQIKVTEDFLKENAPGLAAGQITRPKPADLLKAYFGLLRHDLSELEKREKQLLELARQEEEAAKKLVVYELRGETMRNELARKQVLYDAVIERLREINLIKDYGGYLTEVISPVEAAKGPVAPRLVLVLGLGGVLGLFFGAGLAYMADISDRTFRSTEEVHHALGLPVIGHVPVLLPRNGRAPAPDGEDGQRPIDPIVVCHHRPRSRMAEAFRGLRTALYFSAYGGGHKVIQVTSPNPLDGKTTVAANLAVCMAQSGKRVLLLDCDFWHSHFQELFGIESPVGFSDVLVDEAELPDAIQSSRIENLWLLASGPKPPNPSELLTLPRFEQLIALLREQYDFVLIDSPPVLAVTDPSVIAARVDGALLTVRITKNGRPQAVEAKEMLTSMGVTVLGTVVNAFGQDRNYGYGYYGGKYGYGYYGGKYGYGNGKQDGD
ncbi:MAG: polysaccharide biosynthesis tyrosine autokinase, partial [Planctomycetota bacterium]